MISVLISIKPKYCELIANGKKTVEVRKTIPNIEPPFKCYIYCTKASKKHQTICGCMVLNSDELYRHPTQGIKYGDSIEMMLCDDYGKDNFLNGKVIGEFVCDGIFDLCDTGTEFTAITDFDISGCCLNYDELRTYSKGKVIYGWHISELKIYDKPKYLNEFPNWGRVIKRAPQSWCYVES